MFKGVLVNRVIPGGYDLRRCRTPFGYILLKNPGPLGKYSLNFSNGTQNGSEKNYAGAGHFEQFFQRYFCVI